MKAGNSLSALWFAAGLFSATLAAQAVAQEWKPDKPVELVATNAPGGGSDRIGRIMIKILQERKLVSAPVNLVNRPGGGSAVAYNYINQHPGNGHYLVMGSRSFLTNNIAGHGPHYSEFTPVAHLLDPVTRPRLVNGRRYRPLHPIAPKESRCLAQLADGRTLLADLRASDLRRVLHPHEPTDPVQRRRLTGRVSRHLRLYRAHGLLAKITGTRRYRVTPKGHQIIVAALRCRAATLKQLAA